MFVFQGANRLLGCMMKTYFDIIRYRYFNYLKCKAARFLIKLLFLLTAFHTCSALSLACVTNGQSGQGLRTHNPNNSPANFTAQKIVYLIWKLNSYFASGTNSYPFFSSYLHTELNEVYDRCKKEKKRKEFMLFLRRSNINSGGNHIHKKILEIIEIPEKICSCNLSNFFYFFFL